MQVQDCRFHEILDVRRPKYFATSVFHFLTTDAIFNIHSDPFAQDPVTSHKAKVTKKKKMLCKCNLYEGSKVSNTFRPQCGRHLHSFFLIRTQFIKT